MVKRKLFRIIVIALVAITPLFFIAANYAEGIFPLSEISKLDLKKAGLKIKTKEIYNPNGTSLVDALVRVGGCTGSFVSNEGLIITNHHCAFSSAANASTAKNDYITNGFLAKEREQEIPSAITCRITASYKDVSAEVLKGTENVDANERAAIISKNIKSIEAAEQAANPDLEIEISEMFIGKAYTLFRYQQIKDVRLVYIPQRSVGEFGGESDNWVWPRHNGDFAFFRAYVGKDGKPAEYSKDNVPYTPKKFLKVNANGVKENDFVFILGYPGRTYRHRPAKFLDHQNDYILPMISEWYDYQIEAAEDVSRGDKDLEIRLSTFIKRRANVTKNFKGKLQGLRRTDILANKKAQEVEMQKMIDADPELKKKYGNLFSEIDKVYADIFATQKRDYYLGQLYNNGAYNLAAFIGFHSDAVSKLPTDQEQNDYLKEFIPKLKETFAKQYRFTYPELDKKLLTQLLKYMRDLDKSEQIPVVNTLFTSDEKVEEAVDLAYRQGMFDRDKMLELFDKDPAKLLSMKNPLVTMAKETNPIYQGLAEKQKEQQNKLTALTAQLLEVKQLYSKENFIPDANSTLRFTYGHVKGYSPNDAEYHAPFTTVRGIIEKAQNSGDYYLESHIKELLKHANQNSIVCLLYNLDTTGGNSGSPILDAKGNIIGVNFDRATSATINDYAWNEDYSRSIGVDIRYVLLIMKDLAKADHLIAEMGVKM
ncbi:MAG: S46 family peptidase [bacterium]